MSFDPKNPEAGLEAPIQQEDDAAAAQVVFRRGHLGVIAGGMEDEPATIPVARQPASADTLRRRYEDAATRALNRARELGALSTMPINPATGERHTDDTTAEAPESQQRRQVRRVVRNPWGQRDV